ncbi:MAG: UDP-N-acetyl-D-mannosamine dehydrogenase [Actinobacteria bacterium]|nr:MAG: UDP-N-acetyl-D-mannosamine dehydrogenase [Actinomycetota bacterium]
MSSSDLAPVHGKIAVIGMGYIGLPTAVTFAQAGWDVVGVDVDPQRVKLINSAVLPFVEEGFEALLKKAVESGRFRATTTPESADVCILSLPTPFLEDHSADLRSIEAAVDSIIPALNGGELIILESTVPPGTTQHVSQRVLQQRPDLSGQLFFAHSPERVLPGRIVEEITKNDRVVGGLTPEATQRAHDLYATFCTGEIAQTDAKTAELSKLVENSFRDVNIAFANEISLICDRLGIDVWELIELANHHPRVNILSPGPGVGGHCIAVDPWFIVSTAPDLAHLVRMAREVNDSKPRWVIEEVASAIEQAPPHAQVALLGLTFKADIDDLRGSPALDIASTLARSYPTVSFSVVEPHISKMPPSLSEYENVKLAALDDALDSCEIIVLLVGHEPFHHIDTGRIVKRVVIDTRGIWKL